MSFIKKIIDISNDEYYVRCTLFKNFDLFSFQKNAQERFLFKLFGLRFTITKKRLKPEQINELNKIYETELLENLCIPNVRTSRETLDELINTNKSICRYGDGEFNLIFGEDLPFQTYSLELAKRMKEILVSKDKDIMISVPNVFGSLEQFNDMDEFFWRKYVVLHREKVNEVLDMKKMYFDTEVTRPYIGVRDKSICPQYFEDFKKVWADKDIVIVEGAGSRLGVGNDLFSGVKSIQRILCPSSNAFDKYQEIFEVCKKQSKEKMFLLALGPTATVLAYDLAKLGYRALDVGHLDIEYEWMLSKTLVKTLVKDKYVNEVKGGRKVTAICDEKYLSEIILDLSDESDKTYFYYNLKEFLKAILSFQSYSETHNILRFMGIKLKFPKSAYRKKKEENRYYYYINNNIDITTLPPAEGQVRDIQLANLVLLKELDYVCRTNGLKYWLDAGTLIGAIRHKGFIPWDDDIDTAMMREDYEKIIEVFNNTTRNPDIFAGYVRDDKNPCQYMIKIRHKKCKYLFVDIFPWDLYGEKIPVEEQLEISKKIKRIRKNFLDTTDFYTPDIDVMSKINTAMAEEVLTSPKPERIEDGIFVWGLDFNHRWDNWFTDYEVAFPLKEIEFEGLKFMCMNNPDAFLRRVYGDYMAYPKKIGFGHSMYANLNSKEKAVIEELKVLLNEKK